MDAAPNYPLSQTPSHKIPNQDENLKLGKKVTKPLETQIIILKTTETPIHKLPKFQPNTNAPYHEISTQPNKSQNMETKTDKPKYKEQPLITHHITQTSAAPPNSISEHQKPINNVKLYCKTFTTSPKSANQRKVKQNHTNKLDHKRRKISFL